MGDMRLSFLCRHAFQIAVIRRNQNRKAFFKRRPRHTPQIAADAGRGGQLRRVVGRMANHITVGKIDATQVADMAQRRGMDSAELERLLAPNLD